MLPCTRPDARRSRLRASRTARRTRRRDELDDVFDSVARYFALLVRADAAAILHTICNDERSVSSIVAGDRRHADQRVAPSRAACTRRASSPAARRQHGALPPADPGVRADLPHVCVRIAGAHRRGCAAAPGAARLRAREHDESHGDRHPTTDASARLPSRAARLAAGGFLRCARVDAAAPRPRGARAADAGRAEPAAARAAVEQVRLARRCSRRRTAFRRSSKRTSGAARARASRARRIRRSRSRRCRACSASSRRRACISSAITPACPRSIRTSTG